MAKNAMSEPATKADVELLSEAMQALREVNEADVAAIRARLEELREATGADAERLREALEALRAVNQADVAAIRVRLAELREVEHEAYAKKTDLEGWAQRIIAVIIERVDKMMKEGFAKQRVELARELREDLSADIRSENEQTRAEMRAHVEELKATHATRAELQAHVDDIAVHRARRRRS